MNEVKRPKKPWIFCYGIVMLVIVLFNTGILDDPNLTERLYNAGATFGASSSRLPNWHVP